MRDLDIKKCLDARVADGSLSQKMADEAYKRIIALQREYARDMAPDQALSAAQAETARIMKEAAEFKKFQAQRQLLTLDAVQREIEEHPNGMAAGAMALLVKDMHGKATGANVETLQEVIQGRLFSMVADGLETYRSKAAGLVQDKAGLRQVVREIYGETTGDGTAAAMARGWNKAAKYAAERFRAAGGELLLREDWRLPQVSDGRRIKQVGRDAWKQHMDDAVRAGDLEITDFDTGAPLRADDLRLEPMLNKSFDNITREAGPFEKGGAGGYNERRVFHWKNAEAWLKYNEKYGVGNDIYGMMVGHLHAMARDIAMVERLGPNHGATIRAIANRLHEADEAEGLSRLKPMRAVEGTDAFIRTYDYLSGRLATAHSEVVAAIGGGLRSFLTATSLGSALISAVYPDAAMTSLAAKANGLPFLKIMQTALGQMNPANEADRAFALRMGIVTHAVMDSALMSKRFGDEIVGDRLMGRMASFIIRAQGLSAWTNGMKNAFTLEFMGLLADEAGKPLDQVVEPLRATLQRYGFTAAEWDAARTAAQVDYKGAKFFDPGAVDDQKLADKLMGVMVQERQYAILEADARTRQITTAGLQRGTIMGEFARTLTLFKSFSVTMMTTTMARTQWADTAGGKLGRAAGVVLLLTAAGALSIQTRQIWTGKDPRRIDDPNFWGAAFMQGGAAGIFGDFIYSGYSRGDQSFVATLAGPAAGLAENVGKLTLPQVRKAFEGGETSVGSQAARMLRTYTPGSNLWYLRAALDRALWDNVQEMLDPQYRQSFQRMERRAMQDYNQEFFMRPGQGVIPQRAPDLGAVIGGSR